MLEEIGATIGPVAEFLTLTEPRGTTTVVQHYFLADLLEMDLARRHGPELDDPDTGAFEPIRVEASRPAVAALNLQPAELADYVLGHVEAWRT